MKIELHLLQSFAPACLNRDDTGAPKDCEFGGARRARVSSQAWKRAMRQAFAAQDLLPKEQLAVRTKRIVEDVAARVSLKKGIDPAAVQPVVQYAIEAAGIGIKEEKDGTRKTEYLVFMPRANLEAIAGQLVEHWDAYAAAAVGEAGAEGGKAKAKTSRKKGDAGELPKELIKPLTDSLASASNAPEIALFGRMIADKPGWNVDASCQVAHAISTHRVSMEFDFFTAVDDLKADDTTGADMMGTIQFNSACFYRYLLLDVDELIRNLGGGEENDDGVTAAQAAVDAFLRAAILAIPDARQNSMAAQSLPGFVSAVVRESGAPWSLANAFLKPIRASDRDGDLMHASTAALDRHLGSLAAMYGTKGIREIAFSSLGGADTLEHLSDGADSALRAKEGGRTLVRNARDIDALIAGVRSAAFGDRA